MQNTDIIADNYKFNFKILLKKIYELNYVAVHYF